MFRTSRFRGIFPKSFRARRHIASIIASRPIKLEVPHGRLGSSMLAGSFSYHHPQRPVWSFWPPRNWARLHPRKRTWIPKMMVWKRCFFFKYGHLNIGCNNRCKRILKKMITSCIWISWRKIDYMYTEILNRPTSSDIFWASTVQCHFSDFCW